MNVSQTDYKSNIMPGTGQIGQGYTQLPIHIIARPQSRFCVYNSAPVRGNIASAPRKRELHRGLAGAGTWLDGPGTGRSRVGGSRDASDHTSLGAHGPVTASQAHNLPDGSCGPEPGSLIATYRYNGLLNR